MSTLKVTNIESPSGGGVNAKITDINGGQLSNRNLFINGAMRVAQRGASVTGVTSASYPAIDRMIWALNTAGTWTVTQESDGPEGFTKSFKALCTTADASPAAADYAVFQYKPEAQDLQHLNYGTSDALQMTVSFYVKSNKTGNASWGILQPDNSYRQMGNSYTINAANTWEYKTINIPADVSGVINDDNGEGFLIEWWCNSGSNFTGGSHSTTWEANDDTDRNASNIGIGQAVNDYFQITGIQLEVGTVATAFEHRSYCDDLARCQRYYYRHADRSGTQGRSVGTFAMYQSTRCFGAVHFPVTMRATPTLDASDFTNAFKCFANANNQGFDGWAAIQETGTTNCIIESDATLSLTAAAGAWVRLENSAAQISFNAEL